MVGNLDVRFISVPSLSILLLAVFSCPLVSCWWLPPRTFLWVSSTGSVSTYSSDPAQGWLRVFTSPDYGWVKGWCVFSIPPLGSHGIGFNPPSFNFTLHVVRMINASFVELDFNGSDLMVRGFWEVNNMTNPSTSSDVFGLIQNMTVKSGELSITGNWSSFTINIEGYKSVQGNITSYFVGEVYGHYPYADLDDDGTIDMRDIGRIARAFASVFGFSFRYDFRADINFDFIVDMRDIGVCARRFGTGPVRPQ